MIQVFFYCPRIKTEFSNTNSLTTYINNNERDQTTVCYFLEIDIW